MITRLVPVGRPDLGNSSAVNARMPPSPWLSARITSARYLTEMITINAQNTTEATPTCSPRPPAAPRAQRLTERVQRTRADVAYTMPTAPNANEPSAHRRHASRAGARPSRAAPYPPASEAHRFLGPDPDQDRPRPPGQGLCDAGSGHRGNRTRGGARQLGTSRLPSLVRSHEPFRALSTRAAEQSAGYPSPPLTGARRDYRRSRERLRAGGLGRGSAALLTTTIGDLAGARSCASGSAPDLRSEVGVDVHVAARRWRRTAHYRRSGGSLAIHAPLGGDLATCRRGSRPVVLIAPTRR